MRIGLHANPNRPRALELARAAIERLHGQAEVVLSTETAGVLGISGIPSESFEAMRADVLVAIGGDGTFLLCVQRSTIPVLPVNGGTVGFLAEVEGERIEEFRTALDRVVRGQYTLEERMRIAAQVDGVHLADAINEVVIHSSQVAKMRFFEVSIDGARVGRVRADGMLVATPTGSTSYSMSAGGPIVDPTIEAMIVTSLAPFPAVARAVVLDPLRTVGIRLLPDKEGVVVIDGRSESPLRAGGEVLCYRSARKALFVRITPQYFRKLRGKNILPWLESDGGGEPSAGGYVPPPA